MTARSVMVLGCTSGAGKSWLATALCRWYADRGLKVAPFKAQNMSNHARVVDLADGPLGGLGEIGSAQYFQALAARARPEVRMNPVLLKPEADTRSQVVLMGRVRDDLTAMPWRERAALLWPTAEAALHALAAEHDVLVIEGAGSPAEINLAASDYVNTRTALAARAACLLVADIDRGGAFAHLYGTHALMDGGVRQQLRGFVLNKFRGDAGLLAPAPEQLRELTGVPTLAVLPLLRGHGLPEEDTVPDGAAAAPGAPRVVVLAAPHASNLDEFEPLRRAGVALAFARDAPTLAAADWLVLPGSKHSLADLAWLRHEGLDAVVRAHAAAGRPLLAVCGGLQLAGRTLDDVAGVEGGTAGAGLGLGLLPLATRFGAVKRLARRRARFAATLDGPWAALGGIEVDGYEIHHGLSAAEDAGLHVALRGADAATQSRTPPAGGAGMDAACDAAAPLGWQRGSVLAVYLHGLFENAAVTRALFGASGPGIEAAGGLEAAFDRLASHVDAAFRPGALMALLEDGR